MNLFLAASSKDRFTARLLIQEIEARGHTCHDWTSDPGYTDPAEMLPCRIASENMDALAEAQGLIWLVSENASTGAGFEAGYALAKGLPVFVLQCCEQVPEWNVYAFADGVDWRGSLNDALSSMACEVNR